MFTRHLLAVPRISRGFATHTGPLVAVPAALHLKTGQSFNGRSFGAPKSIYGETVFSTSITSYTESMTDPSYRGQILVFTTPLIGNYGVPHNSAPFDSQDVGVVLESQGIQCAAVIVGDVAEKFSHHKAVESIASWCKRYDIPGITGVDTRAITRLLRDQGTTLGRVAVGADASAPVPAAHEFWDPSAENLVDQISTKEPYELNPSGSIRIAVLDFGAKANILRSLVRRGAAVTVLPWNYDFNAVRDQFDGLFLTNGPGDPTHCMEAALKLRTTLAEWDKPVFGICMGHQVIGMAAGLDAYRMTFGNRGHNQPVLALASAGSIKAGRVYVTSQNHQYALKLQDPFPQGWEPFFINCNDSSVEGIKSTTDSGKKVWGVQFHPESAGGPLDTIEMFTDFLNECRAHKFMTESGSDNVVSPMTTPQTTMNSFLDPYDLTSGTPPQQSEQSLNEEVSQVFGQLGRFWGDVRKQGQSAFDAARKDIGGVVSQAQQEISKLTAETPKPTDTPEFAPADGAQPAAESSDESATPRTASPSAQTASSSTGVQNIFSRLQSALPPNIVSTVQSTVQSRLPDSMKNESGRIDLTQMRTSLTAEFQRVQGVTRVQAEEYVQKSEALLREAMKEAGEVLRDAVKVIPPEEAQSTPAPNNMLWDGTDMWMMPFDSADSSAKGKDKAARDTQLAVATRAESLLKRLKQNSEIIKLDPEADAASKELYNQWLTTSMKDGIESESWATKISSVLDESPDGQALKANQDLLVPAEMTRETFWQRYFFRVHQIEQEEEKRKALLQRSAESEEDFSWEDEDESTPPAAVPKPADASASSSAPEPSQTLSAPPSETPTPATTSPRESSEESYDVVSSDNGAAAAAAAGKRGDKKTGESDDGGDSDWE
ncbi:carbamoyl-phosphate synthase [Favolaschia claudopus]|uniref:Carbamoyl phosphate synthase arginine-specific small chain n=1 Tax=Favolaschia claudopus TaxID=2862362 RepID=A0AAW0A935_9AGAR